MTISPWWSGKRDLPESELTLGTQLGRGGQGTVTRIEGGEPGYVYKRYIVPGADAAALRTLIALPQKLGPDAGARLDRQTCWPLALVWRDGRVSGFVMREIPPRFIGNPMAGARPRELQYLLYEPKPLWGDIVPLDPVGRVAVAREFAQLFELLHRNMLVIGDVSMRNLLWAPGDPPGAYMLDCDGVRRLGSPAVLPQPTTPDWEDPEQPRTGPDLDTDRYKLALLVGRVLTRSPYARPGGELAFPPEVPDRMRDRIRALFAKAAGQRGTRPDAAEWVRALRDREEIPVTRPQVRVRPPIPTAGADQPRGRRGQIDVSRRRAGPIGQPTTTEGGEPR
jgi:hypothetical protein